MGKLAKVGIFKGQKAPVRNILKESGITWFDGVSRVALKKFGLDSIAQALATGTTLTVPQIKLLIDRASLPALMMLVETVRKEDIKNLPRPIISIPAITWLNDLGFAGALKNASTLFESIGPNKEFQVYIEDLDIFDLNKLESFLAALKEIFPKSKFMTPSLGEIVKQLTPVAAKSAKGFEEQLKDFLSLIKKVGFDRILGSNDRLGLEIIGGAGFPIIVRTLIDRYENSSLLARELYNLNKCAADHNVIGWIPGYESMMTGLRPNASTDFRLLRTLAIGSVVLRNVPFYRATSAYFTIEGVKLSFMFGANDFGFGAFNTEAKHALNLQSIDELSRAISDAEIFHD
ncbi:MAG: hypothetical protein R3A13_11390 [Bdellovibrionota bacterium]